MKQECGGGLVAKLYLTVVIPWTVACQVPLSMGFSRQEYWSGLPFSSPGSQNMRLLMKFREHEGSLKNMVVGIKNKKD